MTEEQQFNESDIVRKARSGKAKYFGLLYDRYIKQIYRFIFFKTMNRADAEDICQQVFMNAWKSIESYDDRGHSFSAWLYRIARNAVIDFYRTRKPTVELAQVENTITDERDLSENLNAHMAHEQLLGFLSKLNAKHREIIVMRFVEELSSREIASILDRSEGAVRILQHRALKNLKKIAGGDNPFHDA